MSSEASTGNKPRGGKFARKNFKRKAARAAAEAGIVPGSAEDNDPSQPWHKKARKEGDPELRGNGNWKLSEDGGSFMVSAPDCPKFVDYYKEQQILDESEWPAFLESLRTKLPTTFRLSTINGMHYNLLHELTHALQATPEQNQIGLATSYTYTDSQTKVSSVVDPPKPMVWYPNSLGWYLRAGKSELKTRGNMFAKFRAFLMAQYDQGNLNRQEAVSMIPPLLLDVQPHHNVLDMCAAPGSKTAQLLEGLHGGVNYTDNFKTPSGMVVANDADTKRAYLLVHQLKRYGSSAFLVTTHDGQQFPNIYKKTAGGEGEQQTDAAATMAAAAAAPAAAPVVASVTDPAAAAGAFNNPDSTLYGSELVQFDRILCDVPCSGDGTMRKNINLWSMWDTKFANGLHSLQVQIACRALEMLRVGGLMVYSTCSFNPIENESVVMELCRRAGGNIEIVDVADKLPGLIRRPGLTTWKVRDTLNDRWASADDEEIKNGTHKNLRASMFPPTQDEIDKYHLQRCMRVVPHSQDTGGFFIVLLRKTGETHGIKNPAAYAKLMAATAAAAAAAGAGAGAAPLSSPDPVVSDAVDEAEAARAKAVLAEMPELDGEGGGAAAAEALAALPPGLDDAEGSKQHKKAVKGKPVDKSRPNEDPFEPMNADAVNKIIDFYGLAHGVDHTNFFTRSDGQRKCYFVAPGIASLLNCPRNGQRLKIVHTGSRCYERGAKAEDATYPCQYRVVQEGVESILPFMTKQVVYPAFEDVLGVLYRHAWAYKDFDREGANKEFYRSLIAHKNGCMVFVLRGSEIAKHVTAFTVADDVAAAASSAPGSASTSAAGAAASPPSRRSIPICIWKTPFSVSLMISQVEQASLLKLLDPEEKSMPADVRAKKEEKIKAEQAKIEERKAKQSAYAEKAKAALAATAAAAAAGKAAADAATTPAAVTVAAPAAAPAADAPASSEPAAAAAAESVQTKTEEEPKMETS